MSDPIATILEEAAEMAGSAGEKGVGLVRLLLSQGGAIYCYPEMVADGIVSVSEAAPLRSQDDFAAAFPLHLRLESIIGIRYAHIEEV